MSAPRRDARRRLHAFPILALAATAFVASACGGGPLCPDGTYDTDAGAALTCAPFTDCPVGTYVSVDGGPTSDRQCTACPDGTYSAGLNAATCQAKSGCPAGTYVVPSGNAEEDDLCVPCPSGTFNVDYGALACVPLTDCLPGTYVAIQGTSTSDRVCVPCMSGTTTLPNEPACLQGWQCPAGTYATHGGACPACGAGFYCAGGDIRWEQCGSTDFDHDLDPATACVAFTTCGPGTYVATAGTSTTDRTCAPCLIGTFTASNDLTACAPHTECATGSYVASSGSAFRDRTCASCPTGTYSGQVDAPACTPYGMCEAGTYVADPGSASIDRTCTPCPAGTYSTQQNATACAPLPSCEPGTYVQVPGTATAPPRCGSCPIGTTTYGPDETSCVPLPLCDAYTTFAPYAQLADARIAEASGLVASRMQPGVYYVHNDSGDTARFFAVDLMGTTLAEFALAGATHVDWEDAARGPTADPARDALYFADVGDNTKSRGTVSVYRVFEPWISVAETTVTLPSHERFDFTYPDGAHDCEAVIVDPRTSDLYLLTKEPGPSQLYRASAPLVAGAPRVLTHLGALQFPDGGVQVTAADVALPGDRIAVRTYQRVYVYGRTGAATLADVLLAPPCLDFESSVGQTEALAFDATGRDLVGTYEGVSAWLFGYDFD